MASLWNQQPYDLYHRPFRLYNVVPDPYWESRVKSDGLALSQTRENTNAPQLFPLEPDSELDDSTSEDLRRFSRVAHEIQGRQPSMVPRATLEPGVERYALGRRFFITRKGHFGLGPANTHPGDSSPFSAAQPYLSC